MYNACFGPHFLGKTAIIPNSLRISTTVVYFSISYNGCGLHRGSAPSISHFRIQANGKVLIWNMQLLCKGENRENWQNMLCQLYTYMYVKPLVIIFWLQQITWPGLPVEEESTASRKTPQMTQQRRKQQDTFKKYLCM